MLRTETGNEKQSQAELDFDVYLFFIFATQKLFITLLSHTVGLLCFVSEKTVKKQSLLIIN